MNRIDGLNPLHTSKTLGGSPPAPVGGSSPQRANGMDEVSGKHDAVVLSFRSREMADVSQAVANAPETRADRVSVLRAQIASGSYQSSARDIAVRLLSSGFGE